MVKPGRRHLCQKKVASVETVVCGDAIVTTGSGRQYGYRVVGCCVRAPRLPRTGKQDRSSALAVLEEGGDARPRRMLPCSW